MQILGFPEDKIWSKNEHQKGGEETHVIFWKDEVQTSGCILFLPMGYWYGFGVCIEKAVNQRMKPERRSRRESNVEATIAKEPLVTEA